MRTKSIKDIDYKDVIDHRVVEDPILKGYYNYRDRVVAAPSVVEGPILKGYYNGDAKYVAFTELWKALF